MQSKAEKEVLYTALAVAVAVALSYTIGFTLQSTGLTVLYVGSPSMEPTIKVGDLLIAKTTPLNNIKVGDIIVYKTRRSVVYPEPIVHRVIKIEVRNGEYYFTTKGDNKYTNPYPDTWAPISPARGDQIIGKVTYWVPKLGYFYMYAQTVPGRIVTAIAVAALTIYMMGLENIKKVLGKSKEKQGGKEADKT